VGFADRFKDAAEAAREDIVERGLLQSGSAVHGVQMSGPTARDNEIVQRARSLGAPDPYTLITHDEVVALTGLPVGGPTLIYADDDVGVRYDAQGAGTNWSFAIHAGHAVDGTTPFDPERWYWWMVELLPGAEEVPLGDNARYRDGLLYVLGEGHAFYVMVDVPETVPSKEWAVRLGHRVLQRFAGGVA
jgi:hypothetical protein